MKGKIFFILVCFFVFFSIFILPQCAYAKLNSTTSAHLGDSSFTFVTFTQPSVLDLGITKKNYSILFDFVTFKLQKELSYLNSSKSSNTTFTFVTFKQQAKVNSSGLLHSAKAYLAASMNFTNRTDLSLSYIIENELYEGREYNISFLINNTGNQKINNILFNFSDSAVLLNLSSREEAYISYSFAARNNSLIYASVLARSQNITLEKSVNFTINTFSPLLIESIYFVPETFNEDSQVYANVTLFSHFDSNLSLFCESYYLDFFVAANSTYSVLVPFTAKNNSNFSAIIDGKTFLVYAQKPVVTGLLPDLSGKIFADELLITTPVSAYNFSVKVIERNLFSIVSEKTYFVPYVFRNVTLPLTNFSNSNEIVAYIDVEDNVLESDKTNNIIKGVFGAKVFVEMGDDVLFKQEYLNYLYSNLNGYSFTNYKSDADIILSVGKTKELHSYLAFRMDSPFRPYNSGIAFYDKFLDKPYQGAIYFDVINGKKKIFVYGNSVSGQINALKRFVHGAERDFIAKDDFSAVKTYDYLSLFEQANAQQISNALNDWMVDVSELNTQSNSKILLRFMHISPSYSDKLKNYLNYTTPVVLAQGLWSNLYSWKSFGVELADSGRNVYLIEITGGPGQDCSDCVNYDFDDLTDDYYPALINAVKSDSGSSKLQYVGFSNGCRTALSSLERGRVSASDIETFVGVGCPGAFEGKDHAKWVIDRIDEKATASLTSNNVSHITFQTLLLSGIFRRPIISNSEKISLNLWRDYDSWMFNETDKQPGNFSVNNFVIIQGTALGTNDLIVTTRDEKEIYDSIVANNMKAYFSLYDTHFGLPDNKKTKYLLTKTLDKDINALQNDSKLKEIQING